MAFKILALNTEKAHDVKEKSLETIRMARVIPIRLSQSTECDFDDVMDRMIAAANTFNVERVKQEDVAKVGGGAPPED